MEPLKLNITNTFDVVNYDNLFNSDYKIAYNKLINRNGAGNDFLGWMDLPEIIDNNILNKIQHTTQRLKKQSDIVVIIGIGGSYLGARAVINALSGHFKKNNDYPEIIYAGHNLCEDYHSELISYLDNFDYSIIVISKSGTTTEPALAFRIIKNHLEKKYGKNNITDRIVSITDKNKGALRTIADKEGYESYIIPDNVGGRFSVLSPVGLVPIATAGFNIKELVSGAKDAVKNAVNDDLSSNLSYLYAAVRNELYKNHKYIELLVSFHSKLHYIQEWWKQLFGESEGKAHKGIFPASADFTTDLHSLGQYIQEGKRHIFETVLTVEQSLSTLIIPNDQDNNDGLNFLSDKRYSFVNSMAEKGTIVAHHTGNVPVINISIPKLNEYYLGQLLYFYEFSCGFSAYMLDVNPFDQPGVEAYKKNMFALLGKPGFEKEREILRKKIQS
ncbi:MAG: glucose-6-phosphate isomerase [Marinilabiliales bacterium]